MPLKLSIFTSFHKSSRGIPVWTGQDRCDTQDTFLTLLP